MKVSLHYLIVRDKNISMLPEYGGKINAMKENLTCVVFFSLFFVVARCHVAL